jgi:uncharacterized protein
LRAFTPADATALAQAVRTYPKTTDYDLSEALQQLGTGEAVVTVLAESGAPTPVAWTRLRAPRSLMAQIEPTAQEAAVTASPLQAKYGRAIDRDSAYERLAARLAAPAAGPGQRPQPHGEQPAENQHHPRAEETAPTAGGVITAVLGSSVGRTWMRTLGNEVIRGMFGTRKRR